MGNINTKFFDDLTNKATWSAGVAFKRSNALPLDKYSVFENLADAQAYIANPETTLGYPGQVIAVAEDDKMVVYVLREVATVNENEETVYSLDLDRVGIVPTGDSKTISVTEDGQISLLVEKGADIKAGAQLTLTADGKLKWINPDTSTAEGQDAAIKALQATVDGTETEDGLVDRMAQAEKAISDEVSRADTAEKALDKKITDLAAEVEKIDFVDEDELKAAINTAKTEISKEIDDDVKIAQDKADEAYALAETKVATDTYNAFVEAYNTYKSEFATTYASDKATLEAADTEIRAMATYAKTFVDNFLKDADVDSETANFIDKLKEIQDELKNLGEEIDLAATLSHVNEQLEAINSEIDLKASISYVNTELGKKANTSDMEVALNAKADAQETTAALTLKADKSYVVEELTKKADTETVNTELAKKADAKAVNAALDTKANTSDVYTKNEVYTKEEIAGLNHATTQNVADEVAAEAAIARAAEEANAKAIKAINDDYLKASDKTELTNAIDGKVDSSKYATDLATTTAGITEAKGLGNQGIADAATAKSAADKAQSTADSAKATAQTNEVNISVLQKAVNGDSENPGLISKVAENESRIGAVEGTVSNHTTQISNNATAITTKAEQADLNTATGRITDLEGIVGNSESGLVKTVAGHTTTLTDHENRIGTLENKVDNDTTYTFENGTEGTFKVTPKDGVAKTIDTGAKAYADNIVGNAKNELNETINSTKTELEGSITSLDGSISGLGERLDTAEADIDTLQETIKGLSGAMHFIGVVEEDPTSDEFNKDGYVDGDVVIFGNKELVFNKGSFVEFGDASINASEISKLAKDIKDLQEVDHEAKHTNTLNDAKAYAEEYANSLANNYATAEQGTKADSAIQTIIGSNGLTATTDADDSTKITIGIDDNTIFHFMGGSATSEW